MEINRKICLLYSQGFETIEPENQWLSVGIVYALPDTVVLQKFTFF